MSTRIDRVIRRARREVGLVVRNAAVDVPGYWEDGYTIVRGVYSKHEIAEFRRFASTHVGPKGDLLATAGLNEALLDGRLVRIASQILGQDRIMYAGDGSFTVNGIQHGFHKDNADRDDPDAPDWRSPYTVLRFGVYLQDHMFHSAGLNLRVGSHNEVNLTGGRIVYVRSLVGDVVVWSLRTTHSGNGLQYLFPSWIYPRPNSTPSTRRWTWVAPRPDKDRMAIFAALGLDDAHHDRYTEYLKSRSYMVNVWRNTQYSDETLRRAEEIGLVVRNVPREIAGDPTVGRLAAWAPLPY